MPPTPQQQLRAVENLRIAQAGLTATHIAENQFRVDCILDERRQNGRIQYLVRWLGHWPGGQTQWVDAYDVSTDSIEEFYMDQSSEEEDDEDDDGSEYAPSEDEDDDDGDLTKARVAPKATKPVKAGVAGHLNVATKGPQHGVVESEAGSQTSVEEENSSDEEDEESSDDEDAQSSNGEGDGPDGEDVEMSDGEAAQSLDKEDDSPHKEDTDGSSQDTETSEDTEDSGDDDDGPNGEDAEMSDEEVVQNTDEQDDASDEKETDGLNQDSESSADSEDSEDDDNDGEDDDDDSVEEDADDAQSHDNKSDGEADATADGAENAGEDAGGSDEDADGSDISDGEQAMYEVWDHINRSQQGYYIRGALASPSLPAQVGSFDNTDLVSGPPFSYTEGDAVMDMEWDHADVNPLRLDDDPFDASRRGSTMSERDAGALFGWTPMWK